MPYDIPASHDTSPPSRWQRPRLLRLLACSCWSVSVGDIRRHCSCSSPRPASVSSSRRRSRTRSTVAVARPRRARRSSCGPSASVAHWRGLQASSAATCSAPSPAMAITLGSHRLRGHRHRRPRARSGARWSPRLFIGIYGQPGHLSYRSIALPAFRLVSAFDRARRRGCLAAISSGLTTGKHRSGAALRCSWCSCSSSVPRGLFGTRVTCDYGRDCSDDRGIWIAAPLVILWCCRAIFITSGFYDYHAQPDGRPRSSSRSPTTCCSARAEMLSFGHAVNFGLAGYCVAALPQRRRPRIHVAVHPLEPAAHCVGRPRRPRSSAIPIGFVSTQARGHRFSP